MSRKYEITHPWLKFALDLAKAPHTIWIGLGEAQSKCEHLAGSALSPEQSSELHRVYLVKGALATAAIEGNTLSEKEVADKLDGKLKLPPSKEYLGKEIDNILAAANGLLHNLDNDDEKITVADLCGFNAKILDGLPLDEDTKPGVIRQHNVVVGTYRGAPGEDVNYLLERLVDQLNEFPSPDGQEIIYGILKAIYAHLYIAWIHPFGDGNGRTARLVEVKVLLHAGVPSSASHLLSNHYNETRSEYYRQLDHASKSGGDIFPFISYAVQGFVDQIRQQIEYVREKQLETAWINYVHSSFKGSNKASDNRKRDLLLEISRMEEPVPGGLVRWTPRPIMSLYDKKTARTMSRDINELLKMKLIVPVDGGYRANKQILKSLLPIRKKREDTAA